jgi:UDP-N-acetylmuramoyl-L-alanyl-D-glutamate--2,6-diaminopimelate ligase
MSPWRLSALAAECGGRVVPAGGDAELCSVELDSRRAVPGALFAALPGLVDDGARHVRDALDRGAVAVLAGGELPGVDVPQWLHPAPRRAVGEAAARVLEHPSRGMFVVGVTGTNGKTTTTWLAGSLLESAGRRPAVLGTVVHRLAGGVEVEARNTTPDACELQRLLARHRELGGDAVALELSSHGLDQERHRGLELDVAVHTNLTRDHLDYHRDMESYARAKERLFDALSPDGAAVLNADDDFAPRAARVALDRGARVYTYGTRSRADLQARDLDVLPQGIRLTLSGMGMEPTRITVPLSGRHNVENALGAAAAVLLSGAPPSAVLEGLARLRPAPGRLEPVDAGGRGFRVFVDYAHTPDGLERVLVAARELLSAQACAPAAASRGRLVLVFGCGGNRDRGKRPAMGAVANRLADVAVVTSDNPRDEDPRAIIGEIVGGFEPRVAALHVEPERRDAIGLALSLARPGDVLVVAGKGHESYQLVGGRRLDFDDRRVIEEQLR